MRTIEQLKNEATALLLESHKRPMAVTLPEIQAILCRDSAANIEGLSELRAKLGNLDVPDSVPIRLPAAQVLVLTTN